MILTLRTERIRPPFPRGQVFTGADRESVYEFVRRAPKIADSVYVLEPGRNKSEGEASEFEDPEKVFRVG